MDMKQFQPICTVFFLGFTIFLVLFTSTSTPALAQSDGLPDNIRFEHINISSGLASSHVYAITQDTEGFMWFGTTQGLNRFDGYEYLLFGNNPNDPDQDIGRNRILALHADRDNDAVWIGTDYLLRHSTTSGKSERYLVSDGSGIEVIVPDGNGNLLFGGHRLGLQIFNIESEEVVGSYYFEPQVDEGRSNTLTDIAIAEDGMIWLGTPNGVYMFNPKTSQFSRPTTLLGLTGSYVSSIEVDDSERVWIGSWDGLYVYDYSNGRLTSFSEVQVGFVQVHSLFRDSRGYVWVGSDKEGVSAYEPATGQFKHYGANDSHPQGIGSGGVFDIYEDDFQSIWFAVLGYGLYRYNPNAQLFDLYLADNSNPRALGHQQVLPIIVDDEETVWVGTDGGGLYALKDGANRFKAYREGKGGLSSNGVLGLTQSEDGTLWVGMWSGGLNQFDPQTETFTHWTIEDGLVTDNIFTLYGDRQNQLWISAWDHGIQLLDLDTKQFVDPFPAHTQRGGNEVEPGLQNISVMTILEASDGTMWFGGYGGLEQYNPRTGLFRHFWADDYSTIRYQMSSNTIFVIHEDKEGVIWVGTDAGLNRIDPKSGIISTYTISDGLPDNVIVGILEDEKGDLWLSTKRGVSVFRKSLDSFQNFSMNTGLQGEEFNRFSYAQADGLMYFGGTNGFNRFDPSEVKSASQADTSHVKLTDFLIDGVSVDPKLDERGSVLEQTINTAEKITLSADDDMFSIKFAALEYTRPGQMRYRYMLEGNDERWIYRGSNGRIATYTNLRPGTYTFRVQPLNADGSPAPEEKEARIKIVVNPHWWETTWFNLLLATGIILFAVIWYRLRLQATTEKLEMNQKEQEANIYRRKNSELQRMNQKLLTLNQEKDDMLGIVAHDLRNPLGVMLMNLDLLISHHDKLSPDKRKKKLKQVEQMVRTTHEMAERLLSEGREKGITAEIEPVSIAPILDELCKQYETKAVQKRLKLIQRWETHRQVGVAADSTMLRQVIDNLLSNAIKYSHPNSAVMLYVEQVENMVSITVQDRGQGMSAEDLEHVFGRYAKLSAKPTQGEQSVGMGLYNVKTLIDSMEGEVTVSSAGKDRGCTFTVKLPRATVANLPTPATVPAFRPAKRPARRTIKTA